MTQTPNCSLKLQITSLKKGQELELDQTAGLT